MTSLLLLKSMLFANVLQKNKKKKRSNTRKNSAVDIKKMCRICNAEKGKISIFKNNYFPNIPEEIKHFSGVAIDKADEFSKSICHECLKLLKGCIRFRDLCQKNQRRLTEMCVKKETINIVDEKNSVRHESEESFNIPSPTFSDENTGIWACTSCTKEFNDMASYNNHLSECNTILNEVAKSSEESNKKTFLCDICGKTARSNANLLVHMAIHENIFPFACTECEYRGRTMDLLKVHRRTHLADKPFKCPQCAKSTTTSSNLAKHMRHVHSTTRPYKCTYCDKAFSYQHDMKRHVKDIHLRQGTVECDVCFKKFNTKKILQGHRWKIHKIKGERHGRLPSYLQCRQLDEHRDDKVHEYDTMIY